MKHAHFTNGVTTMQDIKGEETVGLGPEQSSSVTVKTAMTPCFVATPNPAEIVWNMDQSYMPETPRLPEPIQ